MASAQDLRKRIKTVGNTQQITKAMKMVASARMRRAQARAEGVGPYADKLGQIMRRVSGSIVGGNSPLLEVRDIKRTAYIVIGADKGLAGAYSSNLSKYAESLMAGQDKDSIEIIASGRKVADHFASRGYTVSAKFAGYSDKPEFTDARILMREATNKFVSGQVDQVIVVYTKFVNSMTQEPEHKQLLPVVEPEGQKEEGAYFYMPGEEEVLTALLPQYLESTVYNGLLQAAASELGARMTAMTSATDNASELISKLSLEYNTLRQASITNEISEIVGGANALQ